MRIQALVHMEHETQMSVNTGQPGRSRPQPTCQIKVKEREMQKVIQATTAKRVRKSARAAARVTGGVAGSVMPAGSEGGIRRLPG
mmetsp:Transcript_4770/g.14711  ORF Transcript_4770/g.14711 Transcript_4770/m.14711 type:complete len:85 (-) Transcript_4770:1748-2002(-)